MMVQLTYFKPGSGKYYASGTYDTECRYMFEIFAEVSRMAREHRLPDLIQGHSDFIVLVGVEGHPHDHPALILPQNYNTVV